MTTEFFHKAEDNLNVARLCFDNGYYDACANRSYYAALQAAVAALEDNGIRRDKIEHKWVHAEFSEKLIQRRKIFPSALKSYLMKMQMVRNRADYSDEKIGKKEAHEQIRRSEEMLTMIGKEIR